MSMTGCTSPARPRSSARSRLALAVVIDEGPLSQAGLKSVLVALLLLGLSPVLVHATARAAYVRERGSLALSRRPRSRAT